MSYKEQWQEAYEELLETTGKEPSHDEVRDYLFSEWEDLRDAAKYEN